MLVALITLFLTRKSSSRMYPGLMALVTAIVVGLGTTGFGQANEPDLMEKLNTEAGSHRYKAVSVVDTRSFCSGIYSQLKAWGKDQKMTSVDQVRFADKATTLVVQSTQAGLVQPLIDVQALHGLSDGQKGTYLSTADLFGTALGAEGPFGIATNTDELKYLPAMANEMQIILVTGSTGPLTYSRLRKVKEIANSKDIKIHTVWTGAQQSSANEKRMLAWLAASTGGLYTDLQLAGSVCVPSTL